MQIARSTFRRVAASTFDAVFRDLLACAQLLVNLGRLLDASFSGTLEAVIKV